MDHVCPHYTVSCCWCHHCNQGRGKRRGADRAGDMGVSPLHAALIPLVWVNVLFGSHQGTLHRFVLCVSYGQLCGHWGNWWPFKKNPTQAGWSFWGPRKRWKNKIIPSNCLRLNIEWPRQRLSTAQKEGDETLYGDETRNYRKKTGGIHVQGAGLGGGFGTGVRPPCSLTSLQLAVEVLWF